MTALHYAGKYGYDEIAELLINRCAAWFARRVIYSVNCEHFQLFFALAFHCACQSPASTTPPSRVCRRIVFCPFASGGADSTGALDDAGKSALDHAAENKHALCVAVLEDPDQV